MSFDYSELKDGATELINELGVTWTIKRNDASIGRAKAIRNKLDTSAAHRGMLLALDSSVELLFVSTIELLPGDTITSSKITYQVSSVEKLQPGDTVLLYKVICS
jgi:hypothetical protein